MQISPRLSDADGLITDREDKSTWPQVLIPPEGPAESPQLFPLELQPVGYLTRSVL